MIDRFQASKNNLLIIILVLLSLKLALQIYFYHLGFISVSADEYDRGIRAARWAFGDLPTVLYTGSWLPFELYLNGLSLMIWDNVIWTPRITVFIFSCLLLIYFLRLVQYLYNIYIVTIISGLLLIFNPWFIWLSGTPMLDIYYLSLFIGGLYYFIKWTNKHLTRYIVISAILLFFSTGFHVQSWIFVNSLNLVCCYIVWERYKQKRYKDIVTIFGFFIASNLFIYIYITAEIITTGNFLNFLQSHTEYTKSFYEGYDIGLIQKLYYYPVLLAKWGNLLLIFLPIGIFWIGSKSMRATKLFAFIVGCISLIMFSIFNLFSVPASAAPGRFAHPFIVLFIPYATLGIYALFQHSGYFSNITLRRVLAGAVIIFILAANLALASNFPNKNDQHAIRVGNYLHDLLKSDNDVSDSTAMIELAYWDYLKIKLSSRSFDRIILDREYESETAENIKNRIQSNFLIMQDNDILEHLREKNTKYVLVRDQELKNRLNNLDFIQKFDELEGWDFYRVDLDRFN